MTALSKKRKTLKKESVRALKLFKKLFSLRFVQITSFILLILVIAPVLFFFYLRPVPQEDINYGVTFSNKYAEEIGLNWKDAYIKIMDDLGIDNLRLIAYWDDIESTRDQYDFSDIKWQLDQASQRDIPVILTIGKKVPRYPECFPPKWWREIKDEEVRNSELLEFIGVGITELKGYSNIEKWQIENEPFFPFGHCPYETKYSMVKREVEVVRGLDDRPIIIQDSGEGGYWYPTFALGDYLAISMYRKIWYDFWGALGGNSIYFKYPLAHWTYKIKADITRVPYQRIIVTELQGEPWGPELTTKLSEAEKAKTMSRTDFISTLSYAQQAGFRDIYIWGAEWWLWEKEVNNNPFYWDTIKALVN